MKYDLDAYYLYPSCRGYKVGKITKENKCSLHMSCGDTIRKENFENYSYKLTDEEFKLYNHEFIKNLHKSCCTHTMKDLVSTINKLKEALNNLKGIVQVDTEELQKQINNLSEAINSDLAKTVSLGGTDYVFSKLSEDRLERVE